MTDASQAQVLSELASIQVRLDVVVADIREVKCKVDGLEAARHEHSKRFLRQQHQQPQPQPAHHEPTPHRRLPTAAVGGGLAAGGVLGLLIERLVLFLIGM